MQTDLTSFSPRPHSACSGGALHAEPGQPGVEGGESESPLSAQSCPGNETPPLAPFAGSAVTLGTPTPPPYPVRTDRGDRQHAEPRLRAQIRP